MSSLLLSNKLSTCMSRTLKLCNKCFRKSYLTKCRKWSTAVFFTLPNRRPYQILHKNQNFTSLTISNEKLLTDNSLFYMNSCESDHNSDDLVATAIRNQDSSSDLLNYVDSLHLNDLTPDHVNLALYHAMRLHYQSLYHQHSWLQSNINIAFIQMSIGRDLDEYMVPIKNHPGYEKLISACHLHHQVLDDDKVLSILISLIYLGLSKYDTLTHLYLTKFYRRTDEVPLRQWLMMSQVFKCLNSQNFLMIYKTCESLKRFIKNNSRCSQEDMYIVSYLSINMHKMLKTETILEIIEWLHKELSSADLSERPTYLSTYLRFFKNISHNHFHLRDEISHSVGLLLKACKNIINTFESPDIADICRSLKVMRLYNDEELIETVGKRINNLVNDKTSLVDLSNLMYGLTKLTPNFLVRKFENYLFARMSSENISIDIVTLSNIADSLFELPKMNKDIVILFQNLVTHHSDSIIEYITRFNKISKLLIKYPFIEPENEKIFTEKVIKYMDEKPVSSSYNITYMSRYLLSLNNYEIIPNHVFLAILKALPKWSIGELCKLYANVNNLNLSTSKEQRQRYLQVLGDVQHLLIEKLQDVDNITEIDSIALAMVIHTKFRNSLLTKHVEDTFIKCSENLTAMRVAKAAKLMRQTNFHIPEVFEKFVEYIISNKNETADRSSSNLLKSMAFNGYRPTKMNDLFQPLREIYKKHFSDKNLYLCLSMLNDLTTLQCFPEDLLIEFFNIDTIHDLEKFMEENTDLSMKAQKMLMQVNRCVAIECPHLDIPWFHDHFCKDNIVKIETLNTTSKKLIHEVNELLEQILNGPLFIQKNSYSPFYHKFDFECALNKKKKPVPAALFNDKYEASIQRYAICVLSESSYCKNGKFLNGKECVRKRHLQLLGYKFIEVPFFEWYSMGLTEKLTKKKYLEDKIFKNS